ncbi:uncharacterized protein LOC123557015 [Mercenaria mercenaria]|uniref:uncharacterized protein LOC123557015 n=1 Tax=Mercenaria mercenaria TaxID=6596 RepID=UPI00234FA226|nr:uncharacterized protein LOC123557015 [Mercenaria mercenaria]XP_045204119.2 uncharacterized protein LOC123557015 [Mercenaria mercenaria]XP_045204121.2 uncharacterized protein LOC123557015 [Mercenaria mercenaria]XP_045204122.2 uncharacterized protein LOC123557015 [Mercenaria mercenaria]XP_045204123.2 uncharacterized protein LOC123557015 [Mercenaria mercenaria]XP_045204127.2 uncharacterized protein LOC123557015 [Mercenaria mercenaria]XP_053399295.1 uncharacterized protein LOC123557015 [Mercen
MIPIAMLRSVCFENFVKFEGYQVLDFYDDGHVTFIGENGSGKSSVLEGIRRCLKAELSTSVSSLPNTNQMSYFICNFDDGATEDKHVICGIVVIPEHEKKYDKDETENGRFMWFMMYLWGFIVHCWMWLTNSLNKDKQMVKTFYKFVMKKSGPMHVNLMRVTWSTDDDCRIKSVDLNDITSDRFADKRKRFIDAVTKQASAGKDIKKYLGAVFRRNNVLEIKPKQKEQCNDCQKLLETLSTKIVFTFPLRSIGPLQWSESPRIHPNQRKNNYMEAEKRCEIIKCYLEDSDETKFDKDTERDIFKMITQSDDYTFELVDGKIDLPKRKYALLKTPEGILEAKIFSILMSGKQYRTIILEEPDRGMHPQYIDRMMQVISKHKKRVILTTHHTSLITPWSLSNCFVFKRRQEYCHIISGRSIVDAQTNNVNMKTLRLLTSDHVSDILFAKKVLFFEGDSELLFLTEFRRQILADELEHLNIFQNDKESYSKLKASLSELTLVKMNGKGNMTLCHDVCSKDKLKLGHLIIVDRDANEEELKQTQTNLDVNGDKGGAKVHNSGSKLRTKSKDKCEGKEDFEKNQRKPDWSAKRKEQLKARNVFFWLNGDIEDMLIEMSSEKLLNDLRKQNVYLKVKRNGKKGRSKEKLFLHQSVTTKNVTESVKLIFEHCRIQHDLFQLITYLKRENWDTFSD